MNLYTKTGDKGNTGLLSGERVPKDDLRIGTLGAIDEMTSILGYAKSQIGDEDIRRDIDKVQNQLISIMADIAEGIQHSSRIGAEQVKELEGRIDYYQTMAPDFKGFIVPGVTASSALLDVCRTIARRAEREVVHLNSSHPVDSNDRVYLNRMSDFLYIAARYIEIKEQVTEAVLKAVGASHEEGTQLGLKQAKALIELMESRAAELGFPAVISVADASGEIIAMHFMDGALPASRDISMKKAYTAAALKMSTSDLSKQCQSGQPLFGITNANERIIIFGGGQPLRNGNMVIGAIGVSGGTVDQDQELSEFGLQAFNKGL
jgi:cob(I)alamin adenosyltransferase